jgi:hypothetical protein
MYKRLLLVLCFIGLLGACNRPLGNHRLAKVSSDGYLIGPWDSTPQKQVKYRKALRDRWGQLRAKYVPF